MSAIQPRTGAAGCRRWNHSLAALALAFGGTAWAQVVSVPAAHLHHAEGTVAHAPQGDKEWQDVQPRRLLKRGDRLWTDRGSRAELQAGGHALRLDGQTQLVLDNVGQTATQLSLTQGSLAATVTRLDDGDSFEVGTPNLAFRARQPGDYRIDVDIKEGVTRVVVLSGAAVVYGEQGEVMEVRSGQRHTFRERSLTRVQQPAFVPTDDFDRWAGARRRGEPTVAMPRLAAPPAPAAPKTIDNRRTIVIPGGPAQAAGPTTPQRAGALQVNAPAGAPAGALTPAVIAAPAPAATAAARPQAAGAAPVDVRSAPDAAAAQQAEAKERAEAQVRAQAAQQAQGAAEARSQRQQAEAAERSAREQQQRRAQAAEATRREQERRAVAARRAEQQQQRAAAARRAEEERRLASARREAEQKRLAAARRAEEDRRRASARRAAEERRLAALRQAETQKLAEQARRQQLTRLREQALQEEQAARARREQAARRAEAQRREELARREEMRREDLRREEQDRREEEARREDDLRRQRALADQWRREQERREQEVWLRQRQYHYQPQPLRPAPMGVPARRVS